MSKFKIIEDNILNIFASTLWTVNNIKAIPLNFQSEISGEYLRVEITHDMPRYNKYPGKMIVDIFAEVQKGTGRITQIADCLDSVFNKKNIELNNGNAVQFMDSALSYMGYSKDNPSYYRAIYSIEYNFFRSN